MKLVQLSLKKLDWIIFSESKHIYFINRKDCKSKLDAQMLMMA